MLIPFSNIKKGILPNIEKSWGIFCLSLFKYSKMYPWKFKKPSPIFCSSPFKIFLKSMLRNLKKPGPIFCWSPFQIFKKSILTNFKTPGRIFCSSFFQIFKKGILTNVYKSEKTHPIYCLSPFSNIKNSILKNLKKSWPNFLLIPFSNF